jgi:hypothetical protein
MMDDDHHHHHHHYYYYYYEKETHMLMDIAISEERNVIWKRSVKTLKHKDLTI